MQIKLQTKRSKAEYYLMPMRLFRHLYLSVKITARGGALQYQMDIGVRLTRRKAGAFARHSVRAQAQKMRGHWVRSQILVQK